jgi:uncharacterized protein YdaU (DUF1376 family)
VVAEMTFEEKGVYIDMLALSWRQNPRGSLPANERSLSRLLGIDPRVLRRMLGSRVGSVWSESEGRLVNRRLSAEADKQRDRSDKARESARARWPAPAVRSHNGRNASIEIEIEKPPNPHGQSYPEGFETFWSAWPAGKRKTDKRHTHRKWDAAISAGASEEEILAGLERWKVDEEWTRDGGTYIPAPAVWINRRRWEGQFAAHDADSPQVLGAARIYRSMVEEGVPPAHARSRVRDSVGRDVWDAARALIEERANGEGEGRNKC